MRKVDYLPLSDDLWFKVADKESRIYDTAVEDATPLNELPFDERPTVVSHSGKILARVADDEPEVERSHRERRNRAKLALESEDGVYFYEILAYC
jgi:hypothetical protein